MENVYDFYFIFVLNTSFKSFVKQMFNSSLEQEKANKSPYILKIVLYHLIVWDENIDPVVSLPCHCIIRGLQ